MYEGLTLYPKLYRPEYKLLRFGVAALIFLHILSKLNPKGISPNYFY